MAHELRGRNRLLRLHGQLSSFGIAAAITLLAPSLISPAVASPVASAPDNESLRRSLEVRDDDSSMNVQIWVPIVVVALIVIAAIAMYIYRRAKAAVVGNNRPTNATANGAARELTAEQLAGTINNGAQNQASTNAGATRTRRARRARRTPSQISTRSLPVYAKEPGEQEVVVARGTEDMEDAGMPTAVVMQSVSEDGEDSLHSRNQSRASEYPPLPTTPDNHPLLGEDEDDQNPDQSHQYPPRRAHAEHRQSGQSYDTSNASDETTSLMRADSRPDAQDPRGPTPAYFEAVDSPFDDDRAGRSPMQVNDSRAEPPTAEVAEATITPATRRSGFRNLIGSLPNRLSMSHNRGQSSVSSSADPTHNRETSQSRASSHRPNPSGSSSFINLSPFRTRSRQQSIPNMQSLTSPSLISLASISSPLTHTATRTEFTYPKAGPTPEQLKLISSRESFGRFGVPYGPDAVAYAASQERVDLTVPPPDFETAAASPSIGSPSISSPAIGAAASPTPGPSRLRSSTIESDEEETDAVDRPVEAHTDLMDAHAQAASHAVDDTPQSIAISPAATSTEPAVSVDDVLSPSLARSSETAPDDIKEDESTTDEHTTADPTKDEKPGDAVIPAGDTSDHKEPAITSIPPSAPVSQKAEPIALKADKQEALSDPEDGDGDVSDDNHDHDDAEESEESEDDEDPNDTRKRDTIMVPHTAHEAEDDSDDERDTSKRDTIMMPKHALPPLSIPPPPQVPEEEAATSIKPQAPPPSSYVPPQPKSSAAPPSSFRSPSSFSLNKRSESRASSVRSYATAAESIHAPSTAYHTDYSSDEDNYVSGRETPADMYESAYDDEDDEDEHPETPTTPKMQSPGLPDLERTPGNGHEHGNVSHTLEASDATVRGPTAGASVLPHS